MVGSKGEVKREHGQVKGQVGSGSQVLEVQVQRGGLVAIRAMPGGDAGWVEAVEVFLGEPGL
jgi:hypothetical protein